jgi:DNA-directed RNA polymerase subunit M/transcription elongation factor TFIIS
LPPLLETSRLSFLAEKCAGQLFTTGSISDSSKLLAHTIIPDIHFECPKCKQTLDAPEELAAQLIECPTCKETIEVPVRSQRKEAPKPPEPPKPAPIARLLIECPCCQKQVSTKAEACPNCGHPIASNPSKSPIINNRIEPQKPSNQWTDGQIFLLIIFILAVIAIILVAIASGGLLRSAV